MEHLTVPSTLSYKKKCMTKLITVNTPPLLMLVLM